jgi:hypothetical protein
MAVIYGEHENSSRKKGFFCHFSLVSNSAFITCNSEYTTASNPTRSKQISKAEFNFYPNPALNESDRFASSMPLSASKVRIVEKKDDRNYTHRKVIKFNISISKLVYHEVVGFYLRFHDFCYRC